MPTWSSTTAPWQAMGISEGETGSGTFFRPLSWTAAGAPCCADRFLAYLPAPVLPPEKPTPLRMRHRHPPHELRQAPHHTATVPLQAQPVQPKRFPTPFLDPFPPAIHDKESQVPAGSLGSSGLNHYQERESYCLQKEISNVTSKTNRQRYGPNRWTNC